MPAMITWEFLPGARETDERFFANVGGTDLVVRLTPSGYIGFVVGETVRQVEGVFETPEQAQRATEASI